MRLRFFCLAPLLAACAAPAETPDLDVCRPDTVEPAILGIGPLEFDPNAVLASIQTDGTTGRIGIAIQLNESGAGRLATLTRERLSQPVDLKLDGEVIASPVVHTPILDGRILIAGDFTRFTATEIVERLAPPCLPETPADE